MVAVPERVNTPIFTQKLERHWSAVWAAMTKAWRSKPHVLGDPAGPLNAHLDAHHNRDCLSAIRGMP